jgi:hypothetical protein
MNNEKLNYNEMLERVPDYIFERLSSEEKTIFERNLPEYPDIIKEITDAQQVFKRFDSFSFDRLIDRKTRNMSVGVNKRLSRSKPNRMSFVYRFVLPVFAMILLVIFIYTKPGKTLNDDALTSISKPLIDFSQKDTLSIFEDKISTNDILNANSNIAAFTTNIDELSNIIKLDEYGLRDYFFDEIFKQYSTIELESVAKSTNTQELMEIVKELDENDLQIILKGIENAKIVS